MSLSKYAKYVNEIDGSQVFENENGFVTWREDRKNEWIYITDVYIIPEKRSTGQLSIYSDHVAQIALKQGYTRLLGSVCMNAKNPTRSTQALLRIGYKLYRLEGDMIYFMKEI